MLTRTAPILALLLCLASGRKPGKTPNVQVTKGMSFPPKSPVKPTHDLSSELLERIDAKADQHEHQLLRKYALIAQRLISIQAALEGLEGQIFAEPPVDSGKGFMDVKKYLDHARQYIGRSIRTQLNLVNKALKRTTKAQKQQIHATEKKLNKAVADSTGRLQTLVEDLTSGVNVTIDWTSSALEEALDITSEGVFNTVSGLEAAVGDKINEAQDMTAERIEAVLTNLESRIEESTNEIKGTVLKSGKKNMEVVTALQNEISSQISDSQKNISSSVDVLTSTIGKGNVKLRANVEGAVEESTEVVLNAVDAGNSGAEEELKKLSAAVVERVNRNLRNKVAALESDLKNFVVDRVNPLYNAINYLSERAFKNSLAIRFTKMLLKRVAVGDCSQKPEPWDVEETPDHIKRMDVSGF